MITIKKRISEYPQIDKMNVFLDGCATKLINAGKSVWVLISDTEPFLEEHGARKQEEKYHAMIGDIAKQAVFKTPAATVRMSAYDTAEAKALLVRWFERECEQIGEPLRHGSRIVECQFTGEKITIRASTKDFLKKERLNFIEWLYATGSDGGVRWSEASLTEYQNYREAQL
jgi:hypothetical protein